MSQSTANELVRVLTGKPRRFTASFLMESGERREVQTETVPKVEWNNDFRALVVSTKIKGEYDKEYVIMPWAGVVMMNVEENPK